MTVADDKLEGSKDLDREIAIAIGWTPPALGLPYWHDHEGNHWSALPDWSTSIDDALALVERLLPGWAWFVQRISGVPTRAPLKDYEADLWLPAPHKIKGLKHINPRARSDGATAPLAILAAMLSALSHKEPGK